MTDIILIQPPVQDFYHTRKRTIPYGLACIASALIEEGFSVEILDCLATSKSRPIAVPPEMNYLDSYYSKPDVSPFSLFHGYKHFGYRFERAAQVVKESGAFLVGISSLFTAYSDDALRTAEFIKTVHPGCIIVMGGHHPTEMPERVMQCRAVDYVIRGEGEIALPMLARAIRQGHGTTHIPGLVSRTENEGLTVNPPTFLKNLDRFAPAMHLVRHAFYRRGHRGSHSLVCSRGCPMRCSYCSVGASSSIPYRRRSVKSVLNEIDAAVTLHDVGFIDFEDENISMDRQWFMELLKGISEKYGKLGPELRAMNGLFPPTLDAEIIRTMKEAGFRALNLSLVTTSVEQLKRFKRPVVTAALDEALIHAREYGLQAVTYIIVGAPGQSAEDSLADLLHLARRRVLAGVSIYYPAPGSTDFIKCRDSGVLPNALSLMRSSAVPISDSTTREQSLTLLRLGRILNFTKSLIDAGESIPPPSSNTEFHHEVQCDRLDIGKFLLARFLHDGSIYGLTPVGGLYEHRISKELSRKFSFFLRSATIQGTR